MVDEYEMEELADLAIEELQAFIDTEQQFVEEEHDLISKLLSWDYVMGHLDERIPENLTHLHKLNADIARNLIEIRDLLESERLENMRIIKENKQVLTKLKPDVEHREWKAVKDCVDSSKKKGKILKRLHHNEIEELHSKFMDLMKTMKHSNLVATINEDLTIPKQKENYEKLEEYYFVQLYKFARVYERIFRHLWRKEKALARKLKRTSKKMK